MLAFWRFGTSMATRGVDPQTIRLGDQPGESRSVERYEAGVPEAA